MELVTPGIGLIFWSTLAFLIVLFLLGKFAWKPILGTIKEREDAIENALMAAEMAQEEIEKLKTFNENILREAKAERDNILKAGREAKDIIIAEAKDKAQIEANKIIAQAKETIENQKMSAIVDLKNQVAKLSIEIAEKILREQLSDNEKQKALVNGMIDEISLN
ncbi:MAG: F0F1 ATP synthase subunit B [Bacteroidetes bacterium]|nr:F0F1 ATP synthase subunit B [Bacteroidota bacterium]HET6245718.1 F0F1 ATP synthase subunit B [Bacteroidia bacterium]